MGTRYTKGVPEFVYFVVQSDGWTAGPFVRPQADRENRKFKFVEVPMDKPKGKKLKMSGVERAIGELMNEEKIKNNGKSNPSPIKNAGTLDKEA